MTTNGRVYVRKFDWDEARALRAQGLTYSAIAERFGVHPAAVRLACDGRARSMAANQKAEEQRNGRCVECGARCSHNSSKSTPDRCRDCADAARATSVRPTSLRCVTCREWKPDREFAFSGRANPQRRGRHAQCGGCSSITRRAFREAGKVPCEDGCGRMVEGKGRPNSRTGKNGERVELDPNRPHLCRQRAMRRIHADRRAARAAA